MQTHNLLTYLHYLLKESYFHCEWQLKWQEDWHCIELILQFEFDPPYPEVKLNIDPQEETFLYECKVLFYEPEAANYFATNVIKRVSVDPIEGIKMGEVASILKYLKQKTSQAPAIWYEFIQDETMETFEICWDDIEYQLIKDRLVQSNQYNQHRLFLPIVD